MTPEELRFKCIEIAAKQLGPDRSDVLIAYADDLYKFIIQGRTYTVTTFVGGSGGVSGTTTGGSH